MKAQGPDNRLEVLGFICRWLLLATAGLVSATVILVGGSAAASAPADAQARLLLPDALWLARPSVSLSAYTRPRESTGTGEVYLAVVPGGAQQMVYTDPRSQVSVVSLKNAAVGEHVVRLQGAPYGPLALERGSGRVIVVEPGSTVLAVDARLGGAAGHGPAPDLAALGRTLKTIGPVVQFVEDDVGPAMRARQASSLGLPFVWHEPKGRLAFKSDADYVRPVDQLATLGNLARTLDPGRGAPAGSRSAIVVITADRELALSAARDRYKRFEVHLVSGEAGGPILPRLVRHRSLEALATYLRSRPRMEGPGR